MKRHGVDEFTGDDDVTRLAAEVRGHFEEMDYATETSSGDSVALLHRDARREDDDEEGERPVTYITLVGGGSGTMRLERRGVQPHTVSFEMAHDDFSLRRLAASLAMAARQFIKMQTTL